MMIKILYDILDATETKDKPTTDTKDKPTTETKDKPTTDTTDKPTTETTDKPCSIASKKLSLVETIKQLEQDEPIKEISKENKRPHGYRFFIKNYIEHVVKGGTSKQKIYNSYIDYCNDNNIKPLEMNPFNKKMEERGVISYKNSIMHYRCISHYKSKKDNETIKNDIS